MIGIQLLTLYFALDLALCLGDYEIKGYLFTPKQYPADNINTKFIPLMGVGGDANLSSISNIDGFFQISFKAQGSIKGSLQLNLANQLYKEVIIELNTSNNFIYELGNYILSNSEQQSTYISGCVIAKDTQKPLPQSKVTALYNKPTMLDSQSVMSDSMGCFTFEDQLLKLMIYEVVLSIQMKGYNGFSTTISLYNTFKYNVANSIAMIPNYIKFQLNLKIIDSKQLPVSNTKVSLTCQEKGLINFLLIYQSDSFGVIEVNIDDKFKQDYSYSCVILVVRGVEVGGDIFDIPQVIKIDRVLVIKEFGPKTQSSIIGKVVSMPNNQPLQGVLVSYSLLNQQSTLTDSIGNFSIISDTVSQTSIVILFTIKGYEDQKQTINLPKPPFSLYLPTIQMDPVKVTYTLSFVLNGVIQTPFSDPVFGLTIQTTCDVGGVLQTKSLDQGIFQILIPSMTLNENQGVSCRMVGGREQFNAKTWEFNIKNQQFSSKDFMSPTIQNRIYTSMSNILVIEPLKADIYITGQLQEKQENIQIYVWLNLVQYPTMNNNNKLASPKLNQSMPIGMNQIILQDISIKLTIYNFYIYQLNIIIINTKTKEIYYQTLHDLNSPTNFTLGTINASPPQPANNLFSNFFTSYTGQVIQMPNPNCEHQRNITLPAVKIQFFFQFYQQNLLKQKFFVNSTQSREDGHFSLIVHHPKVPGEYDGLMQLSQGGYVPNTIIISTEITDNDSCLNLDVGIIQVMSLGGPPLCI